MSRLRNADAERKKPAPQRRFASSRHSSVRRPVNPTHSTVESDPLQSTDANSKMSLVLQQFSFIPPLSLQYFSSTAEDLVSHGTPFSSLNSCTFPGRAQSFFPLLRLLVSFKPHRREAELLPARTARPPQKRRPCLPPCQSARSVKARDHGHATPRQRHPAWQRDATRADRTRGRGPRGDSERRRRADAAGSSWCGGGV